MGPPPLTHLRPLKWADWWALGDYKPSNDCKDLKLAVICPFIAIHKLHWALFEARSFLHILLFSLSILTFFVLQKAYKSIQKLHHFMSLPTKSQSLLLCSAELLWQPLSAFKHFCFPLAQEQNDGTEQQTSESFCSMLQRFSFLKYSFFLPKPLILFERLKMLWFPAITRP